MTTSNWIWLGSYFGCGLLAALIFVIREARNYGRLDVGDLMWAFVFLILGWIGIFPMIGQLIDDYSDTVVWRRKPPS